MTDCWTILALPDTASPSEIHQRWRELAGAAHPDRPGGNADTFARLRRARDEATRLAEAAPCPECLGRGTATVDRGFMVASQFCPRCGGGGLLHKKVRSD